MTGDVCNDGCRNECHAIYSGGCRIIQRIPGIPGPKAHNPGKFIIFLGQLGV